MQVWCTSCLKPPKVVLQEVLQKVVRLVAHILGQLFWTRPIKMNLSQKLIV